MNRRVFLLSLISTVVLAACGGGSTLSDIPLFPGTRPAQPTEAALAAEIYDGTKRYISVEAQSSAVLYRIPDDTTYATVKQHYSDMLIGSGWQPDPDVVIEGDTLSYFGWQKGSERFIIGVVENVAGDGAYMVIAQFIK
ncbi:MAG: hypothetical protein FJ040_06100 [Chloroflexi bacterium]|nr:hypothetical protein [Chloroflexota bacterium]